MHPKRTRGEYARGLLKDLDSPLMRGRAGWDAVRDVGLPSRQRSALLLWPHSRGQLPMLPIGMSTVSIGSTRVGALGGCGLLPLFMGLLGWAYQLTDSGGVFRMGHAHVVFGVVYSLCWIVLGCLLCPRRTGTASYTSPE